MNTDIQLERLRERVTEPRDDYDRGECLNCNATLTQADVDNERECTQCGSLIDLADEEEFDWYNANGLLDGDD